MARRLSDSSRFSPSRAPATAFFHRCCLPRLFIFPEKQGRTRGGKWQRERGKTTEGRSDPSCVVLPESSVNSVGRGVALCVVCHGVLRRVETSHAKHHKHEEARRGFCTHAGHNVQNDGLARALRETPYRDAGSRRAFPVFCSFIPISSGRHYHF